MPNIIYFHDFESERKFKLGLAERVALKDTKVMMDHATRGEQKQKEEELRMRKVALNISEDVTDINKKIKTRQKPDKTEHGIEKSVKKTKVNGRRTESCSTSKQNEQQSRYPEKETKLMHFNDEIRSFNPKRKATKEKVRAILFDPSLFDLCMCRNGNCMSTEGDERQDLDHQVDYEAPNEFDFDDSELGYTLVVWDTREVRNDILLVYGGRQVSTPGAKTYIHSGMCKKDVQLLQQVLSIKERTEGITPVGQVVQTVQVPTPLRAIQIVIVLLKMDQIIGFEKEQPIRLQNEGNNSHVRMAKAHRRRLQKHRGWRQKPIQNTQGIIFVVDSNDTEKIMDGILTLDGCGSMMVFG
ncbi:hypothetical protein Tco_1238757 [Tanacetum coccineum]